MSIVWLDMNRAKRFRKRFIPSFHLLGRAIPTPSDCAAIDSKFYGKQETMGESSDSERTRAASIISIRNIERDTFHGCTRTMQHARPARIHAHTFSYTRIHTYSHSTHSAYVHRNTERERDTYRNTERHGQEYGGDTCRHAYTHTHTRIETRPDTRRTRHDPATTYYYCNTTATTITITGWPAIRLTTASKPKLLCNDFYG